MRNFNAMNKQCFIIGALIAFTSLARSQDSSSLNLLNNILYEIPSIKNLKFIQLYEDTYPCRLNSDFNYYVKELKKYIDTTSLRQIINNSNTAKYERKKWKANELEKVKLLSPLQIDSLQKKNRDGIVDVQTSCFYVLTLPVYDKSQSYAVIDFGGGTALNKANGTHYLLKKINGKWKILTSFASWAS